MVAGRVGRPHGLDGSFHVAEPVPPLLAPGRTVGVGGGERTIERRSGTDERPILRVSGVADRDAARALSGANLVVSVAEVPALGEDEWYAHELQGCEAWDGDLRVGTVVRVRPLPSCDVLEVERDGGEEVLVPLVRDAVRGVDVGARRVEVDSGFLGLAEGDG